MLKAQVSLKLGKIFSTDNQVSAYVMYSYIYWLLHLHKAKAVSDKLIFPTMYECFINTEYICACLKKDVAQILSLKQGYMISQKHSASTICDKVLRFLIYNVLINVYTTNTVGKPQFNVTKVCCVTRK